jgi:thiamine biosynthesis lipoprotein
VVESTRVTKRNPGTRIDLGGIAKGYGLVEAAGAMRKRGVDSAVVDMGGDVYAIGRKGNENWKVGIRNPRGGGIIGAAAASNLALVTSGDYERFFWGPDRERYCHIIDPRTGRPASEMASATVIMRDPLTAQGWSKVLFILGPEAFRFAEPAGGFEALVINDSLRAFMTAGLAGAIDTAVLAAIR